MNIKQKEFWAEMPKGNYYVGDLCYVLNDRWDEFCDKAFDRAIDTPKCGRMVLDDGTELAWFQTMWGDGTYKDNRGRKYPVDAGLIGCIKLNDIDFDHERNDLTGGNVIRFDDKFDCGYDKGMIYFGQGVNAIDIHTDDSYEEEDEDEEEYN